MSLRIQSLATTAGYLKSATVPFAEGLTCIIGARGTCKSTIVETLRFVFDCDPSRVKELVRQPEKTDQQAPSSTGLILATLQTGVAKCVANIENPYGEEVVSVEREIGSTPRLYRGGIQELSDKSLLSNVEIYSQGDLQGIADNAERRLALIDRPNLAEIDSLRAERKETAGQLRSLGTNIRARLADIEARRADVRALDQLRSQLSQIQSQRPHVPEELDRERESANQRQHKLKVVTHWVAARDRVLDDLAQFLTGADLPSLPRDLADLEGTSAEVVLAEEARLSALLKHLGEEVHQPNPGLGDAITALRHAVEKANARYIELRQEQHEVNESLKREDVLRQQISHLEQILAELQRFESELRTLQQQREKCRRRLREIADRVFSLRQTEVDQINERHHTRIVLTLEQGARSPEYAQQLMSLLQGSRIRGQDEIAREIAERLPPDQVIDIVESSDISRLSSVLERDTGQLTRLVAYLADRPELYYLESVVLEDHLEITMYDDDVPKPIAQLSKGQMATTLLPLILRDAPYPLVFDQPEDDLDNRFIYDTLVKTLRELKSSRQLIFVTHNANIPVLGEADQVVVMEMETPRSAKPPRSGSVDEMREDIVSLLEGGVEAFRLRQSRYGTLLS